MTAGFRRLEQWAATAGQADKNAAYRALFAIADGSAFRRYTITHDVAHLGELEVQVKSDLVIKICFRHFDAFGLVYIGSRTGADVDQAA